ncbi:DUF2568 domain-containing protein [Paeniglutamicibacter sulfureus]|uniref:DUF2568 domain-containing protein n=1 Tax=Paeniglutamicibacter sulfureus TaxID=43666 RepID=A0ABU2BQ75_9MICC|nr:DUF2568 domain-containing protein [Paeniglutamicibacter sulfureus]MDR7360149.1 hypothetical protein [Paeniglutamicibacter sulfureus]
MASPAKPVVDSISKTKSAGAVPAPGLAKTVAPAKSAGAVSAPGLAKTVAPAKSAGAVSAPGLAKTVAPAKSAGAVPAPGLAKTVAPAKSAGAVSAPGLAKTVAPAKSAGAVPAPGLAKTVAPAKSAGAIPAPGLAKTVAPAKSAGAVPAPGSAKPVSPAARQSVSSTAKTPNSSSAKPGVRQVPTKAAAGKKPFVAAGPVKKTPVGSAALANRPDAPNEPKKNEVAGPLKPGTSPTATSGTLPIAKPAQAAQDIGKATARDSSAGDRPAASLDGTKLTSAPLKPVGAPTAKPGVAAKETNTEKANEASNQTEFEIAARTVSKSTKSGSASPAAPETGGSNPEFPAARADSTPPATPDTSKTAETTTADEAIIEAAGAEEPTNREPAAERDESNSWPAEVNENVGPADSSRPAEESTISDADAGQDRAGAGGGIMMALMIVSFILEVALLGALGIWAMTMLPFSPLVAVIIAVMPVFIFWALFMSPKANLRLPQPYHAVVAHLLFATGAGLLAIAGQPVLAVCMGVLTAISLALTVAVRGQNVESRKKATGRRAAR